MQKLYLRVRVDLGVMEWIRTHTYQSFRTEVSPLNPVQCYIQVTSFEGNFENFIP